MLFILLWENRILLYLFERTAVFIKVYSMDNFMDNKVFLPFLGGGDIMK
ncbi:hypothetical protein SDC9_148751 [bioreactor metagenome]|uniref:Uncharacterized protein n=1 Tax=bioreactor metagenome TaxID=1076179 RepID=A0A645EJT3_9ZZZZ